MSTKLKTEREFDNINTVGDLQQALQKMRLVDAVPISDGFGDPILLLLRRNMESGELSVEIR